MNWQLYRGSGRTKSAARRATVQQAVSCSVQLPDPTVISNMVGSPFNDKIIDFTVDSVDLSTNESATTEDVFTHTVSTMCGPNFLSTGSCFTSTDATADVRPCRHSSITSPATQRRWFNAAAVLHDVRPSASYQRQTAHDHGNVHATVTVDGQHFEGFGTTWRVAKRSAASRALFHILQLRHLTSDL